MASPVTIYRGATIRGTIQLRKKDDCDPKLENPYPIAMGAVITVTLPGEVSPVTLTTTNSEVTVDDAALSTISFVCSATKSLLLALNDSASVDVKVDASGVIDIFENEKVYKIVDPAN